MQSTEPGKIIEQLLDDYYNRDSKIFRDKIEGNFKVFEELENIQDPKTQAVGNFLYSIGLSLLAGKLESYKFLDTRDNIKEKANQAIQKAFEYFKMTEEWQILEQIYDQMIFLLFDQIPRELIPIDDRLKLYEKLIAYCNAQEEISDKLGDKAFLSRDERIPYRYIMGEFRQLLETGTLSIQNAIETNSKLKEKINELEKFPFPKAKFWAKKWKRKYICDVEGNNKISFNGGTLIVTENTLEFKNDCYNRGMKLKFSIDPESKVVEQKACPEMKVLRAGIVIPHASPKILQKYEDDL
ncbi:MAG: hypothetical protein LUQ65_09595, partial [Candidatus Helarchaeota archaeon]|nr:hypothetical protein [Candidatus Helarchaeota archaeon]